ncbi:MAG: exopolyphosphatase [Cyclobacteriaceae bacterium]|nr:exopolyphosphatase [Cyclobacteriaceae bacterium]
MQNKIAIIDLGTNTFHLLIAEGDSRGFNIMYRERLAVKIGQGGINQDIITDEGLHRALVAMQSFKNTIDQQNIRAVYAFGTSALRNARNGFEIARKIQAVTGIDVNIISGEQEAEFIYLGAKSALDMGTEYNLVMDIGGGSVEFILANNDRVFWKESFEIGAQRLLERFQKNDPIVLTEIQALNQYFDDALKPLFDAMDRYPPTVLVGSSGTFDTLSDIFCIKHDIHKSPEEIETPLSIAGFYEIYEELLVKNRAERMLIPGMIEMRVDMIVVASCLIRYLIENHTFERIRVSTYSLKEGVLAHLSSTVGSTI